MGLFGRLFGATPTLEKFDKAYSQGEWASVLSLAEGLPELSEEDRLRVDERVRHAGDRLARINLEQAEASLRGEDRLRAEEHLALVFEQASDEAIRSAAEDLRKQLNEVEPTPISDVSDCASCSSAHAVSHAAPAVLQDENQLAAEESWELTLAALPENWVDAYAALEETERQAVLLAHAGDDQAALDLFERRPEPEWNLVVRYEVAALCLRLNDLVRGATLLEDLLQTAPDHDLAIRLAIDLLMQGGDLPWLEPLLEENVASGIHVGLCRAGLARMAAIRGDVDSLIAQGRASLAAGHADPEVIIWLASALERQGEIDEAEQLLGRLAGSGCSGGAHPLLGEFWLRQQKQPDKALESFKGAARQEPDNPRWVLRIAQAYLLKGWRKEAVDLLRQVLRTPRLDVGLQKEAQAALSESAK